MVGWAIAACISFLSVPPSAPHFTRTEWSPQARASLPGCLVTPAVPRVSYTCVMHWARQLSECLCSCMARAHLVPSIYPSLLCTNDHFLWAMTLDCGEGLEWPKKWLFSGMKQ